MHPNVHCSTIYNSQVMEVTSMPIDRWMNKEDVVHIYTMEYYSAIKNNEIMPFAATWMDLESVILSEVRQRQIYDIAYMWNLIKGYKWTYLQNRNRVTDVENKLMATTGEGVRDKLRDWDWHIHTTIYKIDN